MSNAYHLLSFIGIAALSNQTLAFPGKQKGHLQIVDIGTSPNSNINDNNSTRTTVIIPAHNHPIAAIALDSTGDLVASASEKGTLIRVHEVDSGKRVSELRRGADPADIHWIAFSQPINPPTSGSFGRLAVSSDKGTVHIFTINTMDAGKKEKEEGALMRNRQSRYSEFVISIHPPTCF